MRKTLLLPQQDVVVRQFSLLSLPLFFISFFAINAMLIPIVFLDIACSLYQAIYFSIHKIPKLPRSDYVKVQRHLLPGLTLIQKWSCWYCEYTNGVLSWGLAVANQTEVYSCAIKYSHKSSNVEYQKSFYDPKEFLKKSDFYPKNQQ